MPLTEQEAREIKAQLLKQIEKFPEEARENAKKQILAMNSQELEEFLEKNQLIKKSKGIECIFCSIIKGEIPSYKIEENKKAIAVLNINPFSKANTIIIPKKHSDIESLSSAVFSLAKKIAKKIKSKFKPQEIKIETSKIQGHEIINVIPIYENKKLEQKKASEKELKEIQDKLVKKTREKRKLAKKTKEKELPKAPLRIP